MEEAGTMAVAMLVDIELAGSDTAEWIDTDIELARVAWLGCIVVMTVWWLVVMAEQPPHPSSTAW